MRKTLVPFAGWLLIVAHAIQLAFVFIAWFGMTLMPVDAATLDHHGIAWWMVYYGTISAVVESVGLITLATLMLKAMLRAHAILLWVLPPVIVHGVGHAMFLLELPVQGALLHASPDVVAWAALLAAPKREATGPARPS